MLLCSRMEVQVCGYVWIGKKDVKTLRVSTEILEKGKKKLRFKFIRLRENHTITEQPL